MTYFFVFDPRSRGTCNGNPSPSLIPSRGVPSIHGKRSRKVISGLNKFDADLVTKVAKATAVGGGTLIDIACDPELVLAAKSVSNVPVSAIFLRAFIVGNKPVSEI